MKETAIKITLATALACLAAYFDEMLIPLSVLVIVLIFDYITGMASAWVRGQLSSRIGFQGIVRKIGYLLVVCVGMITDWIIYTTVTQAGVDMSAMFIFGMTACVWLIINELVSMLENLSEIGVPIPSFLTKIITKLKITTEEKADSVADSIPIDKDSNDTDKNNKG